MIVSSINYVENLSTNVLPINYYYNSLKNENKTRFFIPIHKQDIYKHINRMKNLDIQNESLIKNTTTNFRKNDNQEISNALLWLPYVVFTFVLLSLIAVSFFRFHCERGNQYKRRQDEISDKIQHNNQDNLNLLNKIELDTSLSYENKVYMKQPNGLLKDGIPQHLNLFVQYTQIPLEKNEFIEDSENFHDNDKNKKKLLFQSNDSKHKFQNTLHNNELIDNKTSKYLDLSQNSKGPVLFTFNNNGSMVDIRCEKEERTNTFRLDSLSKSDIGGLVIFNQHSCKFSDLEKNNCISEKSLFQNNLQSNRTFSQNSPNRLKNNLVIDNHYISQNNALNNFNNTSISYNPLSVKIKSQQECLKKINHQENFLETKHKLSNVDASNKKYDSNLPNFSNVSLNHNCFLNQPFFNVRHLHKNQQTVFAANRLPKIRSERYNRESEIENEALLIWQKHI